MEEEDEEDHTNLSNVVRTSTTIASNILVDIINMPIDYLLGRPLPPLLC